MRSVPESGVFPKRLHVPAVPAGQWQEGLDQRNRTMVKRATALASSETDRLCWGKTSGGRQAWVSYRASTSHGSGYSRDPPMPTACDLGVKRPRDPCNRRFQGIRSERPVGIGRYKHASELGRSSRNGFVACKRKRWPGIESLLLRFCTCV